MTSKKVSKKKSSTSSQKAAKKASASGKKKVTAKKTAKKTTAKKAAAKKTAKKATKKVAAKKVTKKTAAKKAAPKKATKKPAAKKTAAKKTAAKKTAAKKTAAKKTAAKKTAAKKTAAKKTATKKTAAKPATRPTSTSSAAPQDYVLPQRKSLDLASLAASYRDGGDALAHPVTAEQMDEVSHDGLRGDDGVIRHVDDDGDVAPCRLVDHGEGRFSLCLDDFRMPSVPLFDERGLQGGGYTWEAIADSLIRLRRPELVAGVSYDTEASMFVAMGTRPTMVALAHLLQEALNDEDLLRAAVDAADPDRLE